MDTLTLEKTITALFDVLEEEIKPYKDSPADWRISEGHVAVCLITDEGKVYGKLFGSDKIRQRQFFRIAWQKASQVWITGHATGEYEKIVFGGDMDPEDSPIELPDLIGWVGGQPLQLDDETTVAVGFSGFRGFNDIGIV
ncbi:MAG: hypothetical protein OEY56_13390, partial [Cyclobacteriaceae bacterium]|nr:hypothetical protein [Cyclobacteriaceae bacterium]